MADGSPVPPWLVQDFARAVVGNHAQTETVLGAAYFNILANRYMKSILDPISRNYCAVAAYNTGATDVGRAFISKKSINKAIPVINSMEAPQVYTRLVEALPFRESRKYVRKVLDRARLYQDWE